MRIVLTRSETVFRMANERTSRLGDLFRKDSREFDHEGLELVEKPQERLKLHVAA
jgi:hypothetical protein